MSLREIDAYANKPDVGDHILVIRLVTVYDTEDVVPNCQICPLSDERQEAKRCLASIHHGSSTNSCL